MSALSTTSTFTSASSPSTPGVASSPIDVAMVAVRGITYRCGSPVSLTLTFQGHVGSWFTSVGMICVLLAVWVGARQARKNHDPRINR
jgi:hypothetical protein